MKHILILCLFLNGCAYVKVEHRRGELPKISIKTGNPYCKIRPRIDLDLDDFEVHYKCERKI